ncbi:MAG: phosphate/phosphite/phosphonate ABC transporter substrate-binding protein [Planctomycetes bacterium]|nr:phosphate/phosphite/phosphonate ABC transporter substrate-binding protein [Planctomycetota bacterium]
MRLHFGVYPSDRATTMYRKFTPVLEALSATLETQLKREVDIHLTIFEDYASGIKALANGDVDFVRFGPASYILAEELNPNIQLLAMELRKGLKRFNGLIIAKKESGINAIKDLQGKTFAFGDSNSTIGRYLAQSLMVDAGVSADTLKDFDFVHRHDLVAKAVITGTHDAGAVKASTYKKLCNPDKIKIVVAFENVTKPWVARADLPQKIKDAITASLLELVDSKIIGELGCSGFTKATPKDYELVRKAMKNAEAFTPKEESDNPN